MWSIRCGICLVTPRHRLFDISYLIFENELMRTTEQALSGLLEIPLPPPVPYTPQTVGWLFLGLSLVAGICYAAWRWRRWRIANRYRRAASAKLRALGTLLADPARRGEALAAIPPLVKQPALSFFPRNAIAALSK